MFVANPKKHIGMIRRCKNQDFTQSSTSKNWGFVVLPTLDPKITSSRLTSNVEVKLDSHLWFLSLQRKNECGNDINQGH